MTRPRLLLTFAGRLLGRFRRRLNSICPQGTVDHEPHLLRRKSAIDALAIYEESGRSIHTQRFRFLRRCAYLRLILLCDAGVELGAIQFCQRTLIASDAIERGEALLQIAVWAVDFLSVRVHVIHKIPINLTVLHRLDNSHPPQRASPTDADR